MIRYLVIGAVAGVAVPILLLITNKIPHWLGVRSLSSDVVLIRATMALWPSSIWLIGVGSLFKPYGATILAQSIAANVILYCSISYGVWLGVTKSRVAFFFVGILIIFIWIRLFFHHQ